MFPFFKKHRRTIELSTSTKITPERIEALSFPDLFKDIGDPLQFGRHDTPLKFWLPKAADQVIRDISSQAGDSQSEAFRQLLFTHCYGLYAFTKLRDMKKEIFKDEDSKIFYSLVGHDETPPGKKRITTYWVQELGKNVVSVKIWISARIRDDLQLLANHTGIKLSHYIREIVISRLLGHGTLPKRLSMIEAVPLPAAEDWCNDVNVPWKQVSKVEYEDAEIRQSRFEWVNE
jgi:hypothetical protein